MRIFSVPQNYNKANNVSFGRFADTNAREVVQNTMATDDTVMKPVYDSWAKRIEECDFFEAYTDKESGKVKGRFDDEFVRSNADTTIYSQRVITNNIERLKKRGNLDDLSVRSNLQAINDRLYKFVKALAGVDDSCDEHLEQVELYGNKDKPENYAAMRAEEEAYR